MTNHKVIIRNVIAQGQFTGTLGRHNLCSCNKYPFHHCSMMRAMLFRSLLKEVVFLSEDKLASEHADILNTGS